MTSRSWLRQPRAQVLVALLAISFLPVFASLARGVGESSLSESSATARIPRATGSAASGALPLRARSARGPANRIDPRLLQTIGAPPNGLAGLPPDEQRLALGRGVLRAFAGNERALPIELPRMISAELTTHARRLAYLDRIVRVAREHRDAASLAEARALVIHEISRHTEGLARIAAMAARRTGNAADTRRTWPTSDWQRGSR